MTDEQYKRAYDEALERARQFSEHPLQEDSSNIVEYIFPELEESKDERIRKEIIETFKILGDGKIPVDINYADIFTWLEKQGEPVEINPTEFDTRLQALIGKFDSLPKKELIGSLSFWLNVVQNDGTYKPDEKQGEQKPIIEMKSAEESLGISSEEYNDIVNDCLYGESNSSDKVEPKFKAGDWVIRNNEYTGVPVQVIEFKGYYRCNLNGEVVTLTPNDVHNNFHLWTIQDAKDGDVIVYGDNPDDYHIEVIMLFKAQRNEYSAETYFHIFDNNYRVNDWCDCGKSTHPATKEQCDTLFAKMKEAGYEWDAEKKELKKIEQKSTNENLTDVGHEYYSNLLSNEDNVNNLTDFEATMLHIGESFFGEDAGLDPNDITVVKEQAELLIALARQQEWSKEDETKMRAALAFIKSEFPKKGNEEFMEDTIEWLKSLRPQNMWISVDKEVYVKEPVLAQKIDKSDPFKGYVVCCDHTLVPNVYERYMLLSNIISQNTWKPSDEQMEALADALSLAKNCGEEMAFDLRTLYEQLKKLIE